MNPTIVFAEYLKRHQNINVAFSKEKFNEHWKGSDSKINIQKRKKRHEIEAYKDAGMAQKIARALAEPKLRKKTKARTKTTQEGKRPTRKRTKNIPLNIGGMKGKTYKR